MNNNECILVQFVNEDNKIQTGFLDWMENDDKERIDEIVENKEVICIKWPNADPAEASKMKIKLKKDNIVFTKHSVQILTHGNWVQLREQQNNLEKFGLRNTSKSDRKIAKRNHDSESDEDETVKKSKVKKSVSNLSDFKSLDKNTMDDIQKNNDSPPDEPLAFSSDNESDISLLANDEEYHKLQKNNEELKHSNNELQTKVFELEDKIESLQKNNRLIQNEVEKYKAKIRNLQQENDALNTRYLNTQSDEILSDVVQDIFTINEITTKRLHLLKNDKHTSRVLNSITNSDQSSCTKTTKEGLDTIRKSAESAVETMPGNLKDSDNDTKLAIKTEDAMKENSASQIVTKATLKKCRKDCITNFTFDLLGHVFTAKELASSSAKGTQCNANKNKNFEVKPALDEKKLKIVKAYALKKFGENPDNKKLVNRAVRSKLASSKSSSEVLDIDISD